MDRAALVRLLSHLVAPAISAALTLIVLVVMRRARVDPNKPASVDDVKRSAQLSSGVILALAVLILLSLLAFAVIARGPWEWMLLLIPVAAWMAWWTPAGHRRVTSEAAILVHGIPSRVSAFVADVPGQAKWSPGAVSYTPQPSGAEGARFDSVERGPDGREYRGVITLARDEPGVEVDIGLEGAGSSGDYYHFVAQPDGTLVTKRTVVELPYMLALIGGVWIARGTAKDARQRRVNELLALKAAFESSV